MASTHVTIRDFAALPGYVQDGKWYFPELVITGKKKSVWQVVVTALCTDAAGTVVPCNIVPLLSNTTATAIGRIDVLSRVIRKDGGSTVREAKPTFVRTGKNIGKVSETNAVCQAMRDAFSMYTKKEKATSSFLPPMLAQVYNTGPSSTVVYPVDIQRKYNGLRCVASIVGGVVTYQSRTGNEFPNLEYLDDDVRKLITCTNNSEAPTVRIDGELYVHGMSLQDISGHARGSRKGDIKLNYIVFDFSDTTRPALVWGDRRSTLESCNVKLAFCTIAPTITVHSEDEMMIHHKQYLAEKYEGTMIRLNKPYEYGINSYHSAYLLKVKPFYDAEFELIGWERAEKGKAEGALMLICRTKLGEEFTLTPAMELDERMALANLMEKVEPNNRTHFENHYKGRMMIVYYDELSDSGVPLRARTKMEFREIGY